MSGMIIVLEGLNGVGKTACANALSKQTGVPVVRPFRHDDATHLGREDGGLQDALRALGIPANTYVEDAFVADFLRSTGASAILDRSMASGIAYGLLYGNVKVDQVKPLLQLWSRALKASPRPVLYVYMVAQQHVRMERTEGRWRPTQAQEGKLVRCFDKVFDALKLPKVRLDTTDSAGATFSARRAMKAFERSLAERRQGA